MDKKLTLASETLGFFLWLMVKMDFLGSISLSNFRLTILTTRNLDFDNGHGQNPDYLTSDIFKISAMVELVMVKNVMATGTP